MARTQLSGGGGDGAGSNSKIDRHSNSRSRHGTMANGDSSARIAWCVVSVRQAVRARSELIRNSALIVTSSSGRIENCEGSAEGCVESGGSAQSIPLYR